MPSPCGEGQTDMPINLVNLGEVAQTPLPSPPRGRSPDILNPIPNLENRRRHQAEKEPTPCPLHLERGKPSRRLITIIWVRSHSPKPLSPLPQGTEAKAAMNQNFILDNRHNPQPTSLPSLDLTNCYEMQDKCPL